MSDIAPWDLGDVARNPRARGIRRPEQRPSGGNVPVRSEDSRRRDPGERRRRVTVTEDRRQSETTPALIPTEAPRYCSRRPHTPTVGADLLHRRLPLLRGRHGHLTGAYVHEVEPAGLSWLPGNDGEVGARRRRRRRVHRGELRRRREIGGFLSPDMSAGEGVERGAELTFWATCQSTGRVARRAPGVFAYFQPKIVRHIHCFLGWLEGPIAGSGH
jgi:hypothetical protein